MSEFLEKFGKKISGYRKLRNLSQEKLAELVDVSTTTISTLELGKTFVTYNTLKAIAKALEINEVDLFDFTMGNNKKESIVDLINDKVKQLSPAQQKQIYEIVNTFDN